MFSVIVLLVASFRSAEFYFNNYASIIYKYIVYKYCQFYLT